MYSKKLQFVKGSCRFCPDKETELPGIARDPEDITGCRLVYTGMTFILETQSILGSQLTEKSGLQVTPEQNDSNLVPKERLKLTHQLQNIRKRRMVP